LYSVFFQIRYKFDTTDEITVLVTVASNDPRRPHYATATSRTRIVSIETALAEFPSLAESEGIRENPSNVKISANRHQIQITAGRPQDTRPAANEVNLGARRISTDSAGVPTDSARTTNFPRE
jgi:hypothetical protein